MNYNPHQASTRAVADLIEYGKNPRQHADKQVAQIAASIVEFGFTNPILIDEDDTIIAGHGRLYAAKKLGIETVPVIVLSGLSETQKKALVIADNQLGLVSTWDEAILADLVKDLAGDFDVQLLGFESAELDKLLGEIEAPEPLDEFPADPQPVIQYNIIFDDDGQQEAWFGFVRRLKADFPDDDTLGARLQRFIREGGYGAV